MTKSPAQLDAEIAADLATRQVDSRPLVTRQAEYIQRELAPHGGIVTIKELSSSGGHHVTIEHPTSGHRETYGVSRYGITPGEVRFGNGPAGRAFNKKMRAIIVKTKKLK